VSQNITSKATNTGGTYPDPGLEQLIRNRPMNSMNSGVGKTAMNLKTGFAPKRKSLA
jgi:hypothetical protein